MTLPVTTIALKSRVYIGITIQVIIIPRIKGFSERSSRILFERVLIRTRIGQRSFLGRCSAFVPLSHRGVGKHEMFQMLRCVPVRCDFPACRFTALAAALTARDKPPARAALNTRNMMQQSKATRLLEKRRSGSDPIGKIC